MADNNVVEQGVHNYSQEERYVRPEEPILQEQLEWFQDQKLGLMIHWGPYSQLGLVESWALSDADAEWSRVGYDWEKDPQEFKRQYFNLNKTFKPLRFEPEKWAELAADSGFKYLIFTTKHHDGFCMWDTKQTDYKVTGLTAPSICTSMRTSHVTYSILSGRRGLRQQPISQKQTGILHITGHLATKDRTPLGEGRPINRQSTPGCGRSSLTSLTSRSWSS